MLNNNTDQLVEAILHSKKYRSLYRPTVERIVIDCSKRFPAKKVAKAVKNKLHQIWGAYYIRPNFNKLYLKVKKEASVNLNPKDSLKNLLMLQSSTKERLGILDDFYNQIFSITGEPKTIIEPACGVNALTHFWMDSSIKYLGYDVDQDLITFLNKVFKLFKNECQASVKLGDILIDELPSAEMVLLLKVLTILEKQKKGCSLEILKKVKCKYLVVSFPTKSLSGKDKGMVAFYDRWFTDLIRTTSYSYNRIIFPTELIFVVRKS